MREWPEIPIPGIFQEGADQLTFGRMANLEADHRVIALQTGRQTLQGRQLRPFDIDLDQRDALAGLKHPVQHIVATHQLHGHPARRIHRRGAICRQLKRAAVIGPLLLQDAIPHVRAQCHLHHLQVAAAVQQGIGAQGRCHDRVGFKGNNAREAASHADGMVADIGANIERDTRAAPSTCRDGIDGRQHLRLIGTLGTYPAADDVVVQREQADAALACTQLQLARNPHPKTACEESEIGNGQYRLSG
nr:hypothetical protein [Ottowia beijingensis]